MADWKSYEIAQWLQTTPPNVARALLETGAGLEERNAALEKVATCAKAFMDQSNTTNRGALRKALAELQPNEQKP